MLGFYSRPYEGKPMESSINGITAGGLELQEAPQPLAVGLVTPSSHAGAMPVMLPGMATYGHPMLPSPA